MRTRAGRVLIAVALVTGCADRPRPRAVPDDPSVHHPIGSHTEKLRRDWEVFLARGMFWPDTTASRQYVEAGHAREEAWRMLARTGAGPCDSTYTRTYTNGRQTAC